MADDPEEPIDNGNGNAIVPINVRTRIAYVITTVWALSMVTSVVLAFFMRDWEPNPWVMITMLGLAAAVFGSNFVKGIK